MILTLSIKLGISDGVRKVRSYLSNGVDGKFPGRRVSDSYQVKEWRMIGISEVLEKLNIKLIGGD